MIKIKDYIFNDNEIKMFVDGERIKVVFKNDTHIYIDAKYDDIEWNYKTPQETQRQMQKELCKSCYYRDTISNKIKELEEKNKTFEDYNKDLNNQLDKLEEENKILKENTIHNDKVVDETKWNENLYKSRINKAIEYIGNGNIGIPKKTREKFIKILKGEENER